MASLTKAHWNEEAAKFVQACGRYGFSWSVEGESVVRIDKRFTPNDKDAYVDCDCFGPSVLGFVSAKGGSVWGTDGASVGGYVGLTRGHYVLHVSGTKKSFIAALRRLYGK